MFFLGVFLNQKSRLLIANKRSINLSHKVQTTADVSVMSTAPLVIEILRVYYFGESSATQEHGECGLWLPRITFSQRQRVSNVILSINARILELLTDLPPFYCRRKPATDPI